MWDRAPPLCTTFLMTHFKMHQVTLSFNELTLKDFYKGLSANMIMIIGGMFNLGVEDPELKGVGYSRCVVRLFYYLMWSPRCLDT